MQERVPDLVVAASRDPTSVIKAGGGGAAKLITGGVDKVVTGVQIQALSVVEAALDKTAAATRATAQSVRGVGEGEAEELEVWTLEPKNDGFDDVRAVVSSKFGREKEWEQFSAYVSPRWEAASKTTKTTAKWAKVLGEELVSVVPKPDELALPKVDQLKLPSGGGGLALAKAKPKPKPKPKAAAQKPKAAPSAPFGFFGGGAGKAAAAPKQAKASPKAKEAPKAKGGWFGAVVPSKKAKEPVAAPPAAKKKGWFSTVLPDRSA